MSPPPPTTTTTHPSPIDLAHTAVAIAHLLRDTKYAIVGGAACQLYGSARTTSDVDFVVPRGRVSAVRKLLAADPAHFIIEPRTLHTRYQHTETAPAVEIQILAPPVTFMEGFDDATPMVRVPVPGLRPDKGEASGGAVEVAVLDPVLLLNAKCRAILGRASEAKKSSDAFDVEFLLRYLAEQKIYPTNETLSNATAEFVKWFVASHGQRRLWREVGFDEIRGEIH